MTKTTRAAKRGEERTLHVVVGDTVGAATVESSMESPQILNLELPTIRSSNSTPGLYPKMRPGPHRRICTPVFTEALFATAKIRDQSQGLSVDKGIKER